MRHLTKIPGLRLMLAALCLVAAVPLATGQTWTVAGTQNGFLNSSWSPEDTNNDMVQYGSTSYYYLARTANVTQNNNYGFKVVKNHSWDEAYPNSDYIYSVSSTGTWSIVYIFNFNTNGSSVSLFGPFQSLTIVGEQDLIGADWVTNNTACDMTTSNGVDYTLTLTGLNLAARSYEYKAVQDHTWGKEWPSSGNYSLSIDHAGTYDVTFTFNVLTQTLTAQATAWVTYYAVGNDTGIFPNAWDTGSGTALSDPDGDGIYSWTSGEVHLQRNTDYAYKVRGDDGSWYPDGDNQTFNVSVTGSYTVTVTYDSNSGTVTAVPTLISQDQIGGVYIIGNANTQQWAANAGIAMELDSESGYYTLKNVVLTANSYFALATGLGTDSEDWSTLRAHRLNSTGTSNWAINEAWYDRWMDTKDYVDDNHNWYVLQSGAYDIDFNPATYQVRVTPSHSKLYISYGVNWNYNDNSQEMTTVDGNIYQTTLTLNQGDYFLFSTALSDATALGADSQGYELTQLMIGFAQRLQYNTNNFLFNGPTGKYIVVVNLEKKTVTLRKTADATVTKVFLQKNPAWELDPAGGTYNHQTLAGKRGGIYAWNKLNLQDMGGTYLTSSNGPTNYTYDGEVIIDGNPYDGNRKLQDLADTTTLDGKEWYAWSIANSICEFYFIRKPYQGKDLKSQKVMRRAGEVWLIWRDEDATSNRQDDAVTCDSIQDVTSKYYDVTASGVSDCSTMLEDHYYVYYTNTTGWDSVYCYAWNEVNGLIEFTKVYPGNKCTFVGYDEDGYEVWCYDFGLMEDFHRKYGTDGNGDYIIPTNVIFDNGRGGASQGAAGDSEREQTGDLPFDNGACYDYLGMVYLGNSLNSIINHGIVNGPKYTVEDDLVGVYYDDNAMTRIYETDMAGNPILDAQGNPKFIDVKGALYAKDMEKYSAKSMQPDGTTDYVYEICHHTVSGTYPGGSQIQLKRKDYDQSNWVKIVISPNFDNVHLANTDVTYDKSKFDEEDFASISADEDSRYLEQYVNCIIPGGSMSGNLVNNVNPQMHITNIAKPIAMESPYEKNVYVTGHFNDSVVFSYVHQDWSPGAYKGVYRSVPIMGTDPETNLPCVDTVIVDESRLYKMFYVAPKPQEIAYITWAVYDHPTPALYNFGSTDMTTEPDLPGAFYSPMNWKRSGQLWDGTDPNDPAGAWGTTYGPYSNGYMQYGAVQVNWSLFEGMEIASTETNRPQQPWYRIFKPGQAYKFLALIRYAHGDDINDTEYYPGVYKDSNPGGEYNDGQRPDHVWNAPMRSNTHWADMERVPYDDLDKSKFIIFPLRGSEMDSNGDDIGNVTAVREVKTVPTSKDIVSVRYYNLTGIGSDQPHEGVNIVVTTYTDGSRTSRKVLR